MPVIPTYEEQAQLDPDARGQPRVNLSDAPMQAQIAGGRALQNLGSQVEATGNAVAQRAEQRADQQNRFTAGLQDDARRQDLQIAFEKAKDGVPADGTDFAPGFMAQADAITKDRLDQMPEQQRGQYAQRWAVEREGWAWKSSEFQQKQRKGFDLNALGTFGDAAQQEITTNPDATDSLMQRGLQRIDDAPGLSSAEKLVAKQNYQRTILSTELETRYANDPQGLQEALHTSAPGSTGSTFTRMLNAESGGDPNAVSPKGALGVAQLMPDTARDVAGHLGVHEVANMSDDQLKTYFANNPGVNVKLGRAYFDQMLQRYQGNQAAAVVAYNSGPGRADDWIRKGMDDAVLPKETIAYRNKVLGSPGAPHPDFQSADTTEPVPTSKGFPPGTGSDTAASVGLGSPGAALVPYLVNQRSPSSVTNLNPIFSGRIQQALANAPPEIQAATKIASGFRSDEHQSQLYDAAVQKYGSEDAARKWVAPPGHSNHNAGQAMDLSFSNDAARQWWHDNADHYGLKFPLANEAWHVEPKETRGGGGLPSAGGPGNGPSGGLAYGDGTLNPRYASLTFSDTQRLLSNAAAGQKRVEAAQKEQGKADAYRTEGLMADDVASITATGKGVDSLDPGTVEATVGAQKSQQWQDQRAYAYDVYRGTSDMPLLSNDDIATRIEQHRPVADDAGEGFSRKQAVFTAVQKQGAAILKRRADDPAAVADEAPAVHTLKTQVNPQDPSSYRPIIAARMTRQAALGIPEGERIPITKQEALSVMAPVDNAPAGMDGTAMKSAIASLEAMVGPQYAPRALQYALEQDKADADTSKMLSALMVKASRGRPVTQTETEQLNGVTAGAALRNSPFMGGDDGRRGVGSDAVFDPQGQPAADPANGNQPAAAGPSAAPADAGSGRLAPPDQAITALIRNPSRADQFDAMFGAGSAKRALDKWNKMTGRAANGR